MAGVKDVEPQLSVPEQLRFLSGKQSALARDIREQRSTLVTGIREHVRSQVDLWRQLPNWILEAEGRSGYLDNRARAYYDKVHALSEGYEGYSDMHVPIDLTTGELMTDSENAILSVGLKEGAIDAQNYLNHFKTEAEEDYFGGYNPRKIAQWRADIRAEDPFLTETLDPSLSLEGQADRLRGAILEIEEAATTPDSELTPEQVKNAIGHILRSSNFDDQEDGTELIELDLPELRGLGLPPLRIFPPPRIDIRGAQEIMQCVAFYDRDF